MKKEKKYIIIVILVFVISLMAIRCTSIIKAGSDKKNGEPFEKISVSNESFIEADNGISPQPYYIDFTEEGFFFITEADKAVGPFEYIAEPDLNYSGNKLVRYLGKNGYWGYFSKTGDIITDPIYTSASAFKNGTARVQEKTGEVFYINDIGDPITNTYSDGADNFELQGSFCRVKTNDDKWAIINRNDEIVFSGADSIEPLSEVSPIGFAVKNDKAIIFELDIWGEKTSTQLVSFDTYNKISPVYDGQRYAIAWDHADHMGVVDLQGNVIIPAEYKEITYMHYLERFVFLAEDCDGKTHAITIKE